MNENQFLPAGRRVTAASQGDLRPAHRILVVDDEPLIRRLNTEVLLDSGYQVDIAEDGAVAWAALRLYHYDLLITDNDMPNLSGVDLLKKLYAVGMALPVIMATGTYPEAEFRLHPWIQPGTILLKPYTLGELLGAVAETLHAPAACLCAA